MIEFILIPLYPNRAIADHFFFKLDLTELDQLPYEEKREYNLAWEAVERLVSHETPMHAFLRTENYHPRNGAQRLARYWKYRKELFGNRWLLPMTQVSLRIIVAAGLRTGTRRKKKSFRVFF